MNVIDIVKHYENDARKSVLYININYFDASRELNGTYSICLTKGKDNGWNKAIECFGNCVAYSIETTNDGYVVEITLKNTIETNNVKLLERGFLAYQRHSLEYENYHVEPFEKWAEGEPIKIWKDEYTDSEVSVQYESGKHWCYRAIDLPFPSWE